jgi:hypothetical protein
MKTAWCCSLVVVVGITPSAACKDKTATPSQSAPAPSGATTTPPGAPDPSVAAENPYFAAQDICALVPVEKVAAAVGGTEARSEADTSSPPSCRYFFRVDNRQMSATVQMRADYGLERSAAGDQAKPVTGLGEEAWSHAFTDSTLVYVRRGALVFSVNAAGGGGEKHLPVASSVADVVLATLK